MLEVTEQSGGEEEVSVLHGWLLWQLPLPSVQTPLHPVLGPYPLPRHSRVAVQCVSALQSTAGHQHSHSVAPGTLKALNKSRTYSFGHCSYTVAEMTDVSSVVLLMPV